MKLKLTILTFLAFSPLLRSADFEMVTKASVVATINDLLSSIEQKLNSYEKAEKVTDQRPKGNRFKKCGVRFNSNRHFGFSYLRAKKRLEILKENVLHDQILAEKAPERITKILNKLDDGLEKTVNKSRRMAEKRANRHTKMFVLGMRIPKKYVFGFLMYLMLSPNIANALSFEEDTGPSHNDNRTPDLIDGNLVVANNSSSINWRQADRGNRYEYDAGAQIEADGSIQFANMSSHEFVAVIDAGSSGSRAIIYEYSATPALGEPRLKEVVKAQIKPGISSLSPSNSTEAKIYVNKLINSLQEKIYLHNNKTSSDILLNGMPTHLLATAGMRNTPIDQRTAIFANIEDAFDNSTLLLKTCGTIDGQKEGLYAWAAANFNRVAESNEQLTLGLIEIGGASVQVVYEVDAEMNSRHIANFMVENREFRIYVYSYPTHGENEMKRSITSPGMDPCRLGEQHVSRDSAKECIDVIVSTLSEKCGDTTCPLQGLTEDAEQPQIPSNRRFAVAGMLEYVKHDYVDGKEQQYGMNRDTLRDAADFSCSQSVGEIIAHKGIDNKEDAVGGCFQTALSSATLFGDLDANPRFGGIGVNPDVDLVTERDTHFAIGFILSNMANSRTAADD